MNNPAQAEYYLRRSLQGGHVDGVMYFSMKFPENYITKFEEIGLPVVLVDTFHEKFDSIRVKNKEGAMLATRHLLQLGHRGIAMINASLDTLPAKDRLEGFRAALEEFDVPFSAERVFTATNGKQDGFNREAGYHSMKNLLQASGGLQSISAIFIASDVQAIGALDAAREMGVRVPDDIAIVSFDDIELAEHSQLTTMRQPMHEMGTLALDKLFARTKDPKAQPTLTEFMPELIIRQTCGANDASTHSFSSSTRIELEE